MTTPTSLLQLLSLVLLLGSSAALMVSPQPSSHSSSSTAMSYSSSSTIQLPHPSFESRMRDAVQMPRRVVPAVQKVPGRPAHVQEIITLEDYQRVVAEEKEKMVVVRFHAPWCRACKAMAPSYYKLSNDLETKNVKFVDCPVTPKTAELHTALGITSIPFAHVYHPDVGLVEERKLSRARGNYSNFEKVVKTYVEQSCDVTEEGDYSSPWKEEVSSAAATNQL